MSINCNFRSNYSDDVSAAADRADHMLVAHPDHTHTWADSPYMHESGSFVSRTAAGCERLMPKVLRCSACGVADKDVAVCG